MAKEIVFVDAAIGQMVAALKHEGLLDSTTIIITAKHGQSPIDPNRFFPIPGKTNNGNSPGGVIANLLPAIYSNSNNGLGLAEDDISQLWLADPTQTGNAVSMLEANATRRQMGCPGRSSTAHLSMLFATRRVSQSSRSMLHFAPWR